MGTLRGPEPGVQHSRWSSIKLRRGASGRIRIRSLTFLALASNDGVHLGRGHAEAAGEAEPEPEPPIIGGIRKSPVARFAFAFEAAACRSGAPATPLPVSRSPIAAALLRNW